MRNRVWVALALAGIAVPASAASAKQKIDDATYGRKVMRDFAKCSVKYEHALSRKFVLMSPADQLPPEEFQKITDWRCLGLLPVRLRMPLLYYRAALAEELFRREFPSWPTIDATRLAPLDWSTPVVSPVDPRTGKAFDPLYVQRARLSFAADAAAGRLGECVVRASPAGALSLIRTTAESPAELIVLKTLTLQLTGCMKAGQTRTFNRTNLRAAIALSYYRLTWEAVASTQQAAAR